MIPYFDSKLFEIGGLEVHLFGPLVVLGVLLGDRLAVREGVRRGMDAQDVRFLNARIVIGGFLMAHWVSVLFYFPERVKENPWILLYVWNGLSSFGGFAGALIAFVYFTRREKLPRLPYADAVALGLSVGWIFGRLGCATAHDHPGSRSDFFLAVRYPGGARHDLGLYELLFTLVLTAVLFRYARRPRPTGRIVALAMLLYAPVRFLLDFLRATDYGRPDSRYAGLTPAQWACLATLAFGLWLWRHPGPPLPATETPPPPAPA